MDLNKNSEISMQFTYSLESDKRLEIITSVNILKDVGS